MPVPAYVVSARRCTQCRGLVSLMRCHPMQVQRHQRTSRPSAASSGQQADRGMVLPFEPLAMSFSHMWCADRDPPRASLYVMYGTAVDALLSGQASNEWTLALAEGVYRVQQVLGAYARRHGARPRCDQGWWQATPASAEGVASTLSLRLHVRLAPPAHCSSWCRDTIACLTYWCYCLGARANTLREQAVWVVAGCLGRIPARRADGFGGRIWRRQDHPDGAHSYPPLQTKSSDKPSLFLGIQAPANFANEHLASWC